MTHADVSMMRLLQQAMHLAFTVAQDYRTREVLLIAPTGQMFVHHDVSVIRGWLRHYANCGRYGRRCFVDGQHRCGCVSELGQWPLEYGGAEMPTRAITTLR